ncbi:MAG: DNA repair protein RecN [Bacteroidetes bacterium]|nr:DNA repair protein RecN [Bacteroidota bacterium]
MLKKLRISNYALIEHLEIDLETGFSVITGETGAGKSILLGALGLVLGDRAESGVLFDPQNKCIVEAQFDLDGLALEPFFAQNELDYERECIIRREISPGGKSRAFINDSPVNLSQMKELGQRLVDIHSQHDSLLISNAAHQLAIIDDFAQTHSQLEAYRKTYNNYKAQQQQLSALKQTVEENRQRLDLISYQLNELDKSKLSEGELDLIEQQLQTLTHSEEIKTALWTAAHNLNQAEINALGMVKDARAGLAKISSYLPEAAELAERLNNVQIELGDIAREADRLADKVSFDAGELEKLNKRYFDLRSLISKYKATSIEELIELREKLRAQLNTIENSDLEINALQKLLRETENHLHKLAAELRQKRLAEVPNLERSITQTLASLGMPNARFHIRLNLLESPGPTGTEEVKLLFSANKGMPPNDLDKIASGGELSRLMLALKSTFAARKSFPTMVFDEIDTGISGDIAAKAARIMSGLATKTQLIVITHLPQIAARANQHYFVFKREDKQRTKTMIIRLNEKQRVEEIASMLSNDRVTEAARQAARELMKGF